MPYLHRLNEWSNQYHSPWMVIVRVALGLSLLAKGISFIRNSTLLPEIFTSAGIPQALSWMVHFIPWAHMFGGFLIVIGLFTRLAVLLQIPILIGAIIFVNTRSGVYSGSVRSSIFYHCASAADCVFTSRWQRVLLCRPAGKTVAFVNSFIQSFAGHTPYLLRHSLHYVSAILKV